MLNQSHTDVFSKVNKELGRISRIFKQQEQMIKELENPLLRSYAISLIESSARETNEKIVETHRKRIEYCLKNGFSPFL